MLRLILESHPDVFCYDELRGYAVLQKSALESFSETPLVGFKLPRWTEQLAKPVLFDEGSDASCRNFYRGEKILFLQRGVRDTIASMLKLKTGRSSWCETWVPRIIQAKLERDEVFRMRYAVEMSIIKSCASPLIGLAALYWQYKNDAYFDYMNAGMPVLSVPYEDLVRNPRPVLQSVCRHLGIPFHVNLLRHNELPHTELFENGMAVGNTDPRMPIQSASIGQWDRYLSKEDQRVIDRIVLEEADYRLRKAG